MRKFGILIAAFAIVGVAAPVLAHHGFDTEYDANKKVKLEGVVTQVSWTNPHMRVYIDVTGPDGKVRQGWGPTDLKAGDRVIFEGFGGKVVESRGSLQTIMKKSDMKPLFGPGGPDAAQ